MPEPVRQRLRPAPLSVLILQAETGVMLHRRRISASVSTIKQELQTKLTSPAMFVVAGGVGFAAGVLTRPRRGATVNLKPPSAPPKSPLATLLKLFGVVRTLANILPSSAFRASVPSASWEDDQYSRIARPPPLH